MSCIRTCPKCGMEHEGTQSRCKACYAEWGRMWRRKNPARARAIVKRYQKNHPDRMRRTNRIQNLKSYGLTLETFDALLASQNGRCAICGTDKPNGPGKYFMVDHDHKTKKVRGLLCHNCNTIMGHSFDDADRLRRAIAYLEGGSNFRQGVREHV